MTDYELFRACYPQYDISGAVFEKATKDDEKIHSEHGFVYYSGDKVRLMAVHPEHQNRGEGSRLLAECEEKIRRQGCGRVSLGGGLFCGAEESSCGFFEKRGYSGVDFSFCDMQLETDGIIMPPQPDDSGISFGFFEGELSELHEAVCAVEPDWVQWFTGESPVFCAYKDGRVAAFCIVDEYMSNLLTGDGMKIGSVGCVGTVPQYRRHGTGLYMVALACDYLREKGCNKVTINYTALESWYSKIGAKTYVKFRFMEKSL